MLAVGITLYTNQLELTIGRSSEMLTDPVEKLSLAKVLGNSKGSRETAAGEGKAPIASGRPNFNAGTFDLYELQWPVYDSCNGPSLIPSNLVRTEPMGRSENPRRVKRNTRSLDWSLMRAVMAK